VVYTRLRHEFSIKDLIRCTRNLDPIGAEVPYIVPYAVEVSSLLLRCIAALTREKEPSPSLVLELGTETLKVVSDALQALIPLSESAVDALRTKAKQELGL